MTTGIGSSSRVKSEKKATTKKRKDGDGRGEASASIEEGSDGDSGHDTGACQNASSSTQKRLGAVRAEGSDGCLKHSS